MQALPAFTSLSSSLSHSHHSSGAIPHTARHAAPAACNSRFYHRVCASEDGAVSGRAAWQSCLGCQGHARLSSSCVWLVHPSIAPQHMM